MSSRMQRLFTANGRRIHVKR